MTFAIEIAEQVRRGSVTAESVAEGCLGAIQGDRELGAFLSVAQKDALLETARSIDRKRARGETLGPLAGVPVAVKDALCTLDLPTTCASKILMRGEGGAPVRAATHGWRAPYDATAVARLRAADALIVGKTNMDEFAMGSSNENSAEGPVKNPWDRSRIPGGSSGGSAAAVAARLVSLALGSDTGGSIRQPAGHCGVVGVKPSYGRVSRYGLVAFASSFDQIGPLASDVRSAARLLSTIAGFDTCDSTSANLPVPNYEAACDREIAGLKIGVPAEYFGEGLEPAVEERVRAAILRLEGAGAEIRPVKLPHTRFGVASYYIIATAEASSNLARFDGVRFGLRVEPMRAKLETVYGATRDAGFGTEVKRRILLGTYVLSAGYYDAYYRRAQKVRTLIRRDFDAAFQEVDVLAAPVSPTAAFRLGERISDPLSMYLADVFTLPASLAGIAALSVPCGFTPASPDQPALPVGLQLLGPAFQEERLFTVSSVLEALSPETRAAPPEYQNEVA